MLKRIIQIVPKVRHAALCALLTFLSACGAEAPDKPSPHILTLQDGTKSAFNRGFRFRQIVAGLEAVKSDAGFMICGLAMIADQLERGELTLPFGPAKVAKTQYAFHASYKSASQNRGQVRRFREWLLEYASQTRDAVDAI